MDNETSKIEIDPQRIIAKLTERLKEKEMQIVLLEAYVDILREKDIQGSSVS